MAFYGDQSRFARPEGPRTDARLQEKWVSTPDLATNPRWTRVTLNATPRTTLGGLNLSVIRTETFTPKDQMLVRLLSCVGAVVVDAAREQHHPCTGTASRHVIGEAITNRRAESNPTSQQAFARLSRPSQ